MIIQSELQRNMDFAFLIKLRLSKANLRKGLPVSAPWIDPQTVYSAHSPSLIYTDSIQGTILRCYHRHYLNKSLFSVLFPTSGIKTNCLGRSIQPSAVPVIQNFTDCIFSSPVFASALRQAALPAMPHFLFSGLWLPSASATPGGAELPKGHPANGQHQQIPQSRRKEKGGKKNSRKNERWCQECRRKKLQRAETQLQVQQQWKWEGDFHVYL